MSDSENLAPAQTFAERMRDAAEQRIAEQQAQFRRVRDLVLGTSQTRDRVGDVIQLSDSDFLVEVITPLSTTWTTVVGDKRAFEHWHTQDEALLHLVARRHNTNGHGDTAAAAYYAARVLGITEKE